MESPKPASRPVQKQAHNSTSRLVDSSVIPCELVSARAPKATLVRRPAADYTHLAQKLAMWPAARGLHRADRICLTLIATAGLGLKKSLVFLLQWVSAGLAVAFIVMLLRPDLVGSKEDSAGYRPQATGSFSQAVASAGPSVVNIYTRRQVAARGNATTSRNTAPGRAIRSRSPAIRYENSLGSGVIVSADGYVLTNNHVVDKALEIAVLLADGRYAAAEVLGSDPDTDLALLRIGLDGLAPIKMGRSETVHVGDVVLAIGNPLGLGQTVTQGIVSATGRSRLGLSTFEDFIQTDALINEGNSGGALINARGELIGINTAVLSQHLRTQSTGIGFAIPVSMARGVMAQLIEHGHVIRGWLGVSSFEVTPELAEAAGLKSARGLWIDEVYAGTPAEEAGLRRGDILTHVNGREIFYGQEALNLIAGMPPGDIVELAGSRGGRGFSARVRISERPSPGS